MIPERPRQPRRAAPVGLASPGALLRILERWPAQNAETGVTTGAAAPTVAL